MINIALAQINATVGDIDGNFKKIVDALRVARREKADVVVFPELALCGYPPEDLLLKEHFVTSNLKKMRLLAKETKGLTAMVGFVDRDKKNRLYNAAAIFSNGKLASVYHKKELPNYGVFDEKRYFTSGNDKGLIRYGGVLCGVSICEDIWIDGSIASLQAKAGAKVLINISSSPYDSDKLETRIKLLQQRARSLKSFVVYCNLVGGQDELVFDGTSLVVDPKGKIVAQAKEFSEDILFVDIDFKKSLAVTNTKNTPLTNLERIYQALVLGTRDYVQKNGFKKVLIGLSGGIDSALVAAVAVDAIGKENVVGISMPSRFSSAGTQSDARLIAKNLGITFKEIPIEPIFQQFLVTLSQEFAGLKSDLAEENIQARVRGNLLMAMSNKFGWLVLTTGNKSEMGVGYCTLYGDMSGGFAVIKDVPKTLVYKLSTLKNKQAGFDIIPQSIIDRPPTAELRENQKDQDSLPPYEVLDQILEEYVEKHRSVGQIAKTWDKDVVLKVIRLVDKSEYKRRQSAPGVKITSRAFGKDWRLPITSKYKEF